MEFAGITDKLTITDIAIDKSSKVKETTVFDLKGTVNTALVFDYLKLNTSDFGVGATKTTNNILISLSGNSKTLTSMQHWNIANSTFDKGFTLL